MTSCLVCSSTPWLCPNCPNLAVDKLIRKAGYDFNSFWLIDRAIPRGWDRAYDILSVPNKRFEGDSYFDGVNWVSYTGKVMDITPSAAIHRRPRLAFGFEQTTVLIESAGYTVAKCRMPQHWDNAYDIVPVGEPYARDLEYYNGSVWTKTANSVEKNLIKDLLLIYRRLRKRITLD